MKKYQNVEGQIKYKLEKKDYLIMFPYGMWISGLLMVLIDMCVVFNNSFFEKSVVILFYLCCLILWKWVVYGNDFFTQEEKKEFSEANPLVKIIMVFVCSSILLFIVFSFSLITYALIDIKQLFNNVVFQWIIVLLYSIILFSIVYYFWEKDKYKDFKV